METKDLKILGIVGARSGSKGLPDKNIKPLAGKPLMGWIIEAAKNSKHVNRVIVSTDSEKYAEIAKAQGAEVPVMRPAEISGDLASDLEYIKHTLEWLKSNENYEPDIVLRLLPTVPLQTSDDIDKGIEALLNDNDTDASVVVAEAYQNPAKALKVVEKSGKQYMVSYLIGQGSDATPQARQKYDKAYFRANVVISKLSTIKKFNNLTGENVAYHVIPQDRAVDIDNENDFILAEAILNKSK